jgi:hypothetical protein
MLLPLPDSFAIEPPAAAAVAAADFLLRDEGALSMAMVLRTRR